MPKRAQPRLPAVPHLATSRRAWPRHVVRALPCLRCHPDPDPAETGRSMPYLTPPALRPCRSQLFIEQCIDRDQHLRQLLQVSIAHTKAVQLALGEIELCGAKRLVA